MARISFTAIVDEIVGKLAGSVFQYSYGGFQVHTKGKPRNPQTQYQQLRRGDFGFLSASWRGLTSVQRQTFIDAASTPPEALNLFIQSNVNLILVNEATIDTYIPSSNPGTMDIEFFDVSPASMLIRATGSPTTVPTGTKLLLQVTALKPPTRIFTNPSEYSPVIEFDEGTDLTVLTDILTAWQSRYGVLESNKRLCLKASLIDKSNGLRGSEVINCTTSEEMPLQKIYAANLTQTGTADPVVEESVNQIGAIVWTRTGTGQYIGTLAGAFKTDECSWHINNILQPVTSGAALLTHLTDDTLNIQTFNAIGAPADDLLINTSVLIIHKI